MLAMVGIDAASTRGDGCGQWYMRPIRHIVLPAVLFGTVLMFWFGYQSRVEHRYQRMEERGQFLSDLKKGSA
jgi:hypothetical protein